MNYKITATSEDPEKLKVFDLVVTFFTNVKGSYTSIKYFDTENEARQHLKNVWSKGRGVMFSGLSLTVNGVVATISKI